MALVTALMAMLMMLALGAGVAMTTLTESTIAANHRDGLQALYAAEAGIDLAVSRLRSSTDWQALVTGGTVTLTDGPLAALLQGATVDSRVMVTVTVSPDPNGDDDVLALQSSAIVAGGLRRTVQVSIRKRPATSEIETLSWR
ncbi:MAG TPA: PilX N-terminal domain-containing pilus assembly protein [Vicinamibacterales bacterium]|jgi:hypothetical protein|nr:PilX N-terminal domain-containing pilus assembly protein [Vicinamibacterales bacterium]